LGIELKANQQSPNNSLQLININNRSQDQRTVASLEQVSAAWTPLQPPLCKSFSVQMSRSTLREQCVSWLRPSQVPQGPQMLTYKHIRHKKHTNLHT